MRSAWKIGVICCLTLLCCLVGWKVYRIASYRRSLSQTAEEYRLKAERGNANAEYVLGKMYFHGTGVPQDYVEALRWARKAADQGLTRADSAVVYSYYHGLGVSQSYSEAAHWYRAAAAKGDALGQRDLGYMYRHGLGVLQDNQQAARLFRQSAEQGDASAESELAYLYRRGYGVPQDDAQAANWYRKAAIQGDALAESGIGFMEFYGYGVPENRRDADQWFHKAAEQGDEYARNALGIVWLGMTEVQLAAFLAQFAGGIFLLVSALVPKHKSSQSRRNELWAGCLCLLCSGIWWYGYNHYSIRASTGGFAAFTSFKYLLDAIAIGFLMKVIREKPMQTANVIPN